MIGKPKDFEDYNLYKFKNLEIYITKNISDDSSLELLSANFFGTENLVAVLK